MPKLSIPVGTLDWRPWPEGDEAAGFLRNTTECPTDTQSLSERFYDRNSPQSSALNQLEVFDPLLLLLALLKRGR